MMMNKGMMGLAALLSAGLATGAQATAVLTVNAVQGGGAQGTVRWNLDGGAASAPAGVTVTLTPDAAFVTGSVVNVYAAPVLSGNNGVGFGAPNQPNGTDATVFLTTGSTGAFANAKVELSFTDPQFYFGLLWGSIDNYNTLQFFDGLTPVGTLTGSDVTATPNGDQTVTGTRYVNIDSDTAFNRVVFTSSRYAFEFDNLSWLRDPTGTPPSVPEPASAALLGAGLLGFALLRRRRRAG